MNASDNENIPFESYCSFFHFASEKSSKLPVNDPPASIRRKRKRGDIGHGDNNDDIIDDAGVQMYRKRTLMEWDKVNMGLLVKYIHTRVNGDEDISQLDSSLFQTSDFINEEEKLHLAEIFGLMPQVGFGNIHFKNGMEVDDDYDDDDDDDNDDELEERQIESQAEIQTYHKEGSGSINGFDTQPTAVNLPMTPTGQNSTTTTASPSRPPTSSPYKAAVPCIRNLSHVATNIRDINMLTKSLNIPLATMPLFWEKRRGKRKAPMAGGPIVEFQSEWLENGPLCQMFRSVLSFDLMGIDCDHILEDTNDESDTSTTRSQQLKRQGSHLAARSAFGIGRIGIPEGTIEKKRLRVYLYNDYAIAFQNVMELVQSKYILAKGKDSLRDRIFISLRNIPAMCIFPHSHCSNPGGRFYLNRDCDAAEKVLESGGYGSMSDYCVCIGGRSRMRLHATDGSSPDEIIRLDSEDLEVGILIIDGKGQIVSEGEYALKKNNVSCDRSKTGISGIQVPMEKSSDMRNIYNKLKASSEKSKSARLQEFTQEGKHPSGRSKDTNVSSPPMHSTGKKSIEKPPSPLEWLPLKDVRKFYEETKKKSRNKRAFNIYAAVQDFRPAQLTKKGTYLMTIHVFDETLEKLREEGSTIIEGDDQAVVTHMTISIFSKKKQDLPHILGAGDVIYVNRIVASEWNKAIQLDTWDPRNITILRPTDEALERYEKCDDDNSIPHAPSACEGDWVLNGVQQSTVNYDRVQTLWKAARERISFYPHIDSRFKLINADISQVSSRKVRQNVHDKSNAQHGDLTVMLCNIFRFKEDKRTNQDPMGILRCWDGTGISRCDKIPEDYEIPEGWDLQEEPSEEVISNISKITKRMAIGDRDYKELIDGKKSAFKEIEVPKSLCGRVVNIVVWESEHWTFLHRNDSQFGNGDFMRLKNARLDMDTGCYMINANTSMTPIPESSFEVKRIIKDHQERLFQKHPLNPSSACLPLLLAKRLTNPSSFEPPWFAPIMTSDRGSLLDCVLETSTNIEKIKASFQIIGFSPNLIGESLERLVSFQSGKHEFQLTLQVRDPYINLVLLVPDEIAAKMLGLSARQVAVDNAIGEVSKDHRDGCRRLRSLQGMCMDGTIAVINSHESKFFILSEPTTSQM